MIPGVGRYPGEGKGYPLQYSGLENSLDCMVHESQRVRYDRATFTSLSLSEKTYPPKNKTAKTNVKEYIACFLLRSFKNSGITLKSLIHFEFIFVLAGRE